MSAATKADRMQCIIDNDNMQRKVFLLCIFRKTIYGSSQGADIYLVFQDGTLSSCA